MVKSLRSKSNKSKKTNSLHKLMDLEKLALTVLVGGLLVFVGYHVYQYFKRSEVSEVSEVSEGFKDTDELKENTKMVDVDAENETLTDGSVVEIVFCKMEGCGHCVKFNDNVWQSPEVQKLNGTECPLGVLKLKVVDPNQEYSKDVDGFPTIKKIVNGTTVSTFDGERTVEAFTSWCKSE